MTLLREIGVRARMVIVTLWLQFPSADAFVTLNPRLARPAVES